MAPDDVIASDKVQSAIKVMNRLFTIKGLYLFGSQTDGTADEWSDIDIGVYAEGVEKWSLQEYLDAAAATQKAAGDDFELHFFPASYLTNPPVASFAEYVLKNGIRIDGGITSCPD